MHAFEQLGADSRAAQLIALAIAGHHAGLANWQDLKSRLSRPDLRERIGAALGVAPTEVLTPRTGAPNFPSWFKALAGAARDRVDRESPKRAFEVLVRMTYSALVDADFLDTESFLGRGDPAGASEARTGWSTLGCYERLLTEHLDSLSSLAETPVVHQRRRILAWCRSAASGPRGAYSLTVPTGGGKTLSALAFSLRHALTNGHDRIVYALPFLSILDQTADVFRDVFGSVLGERVLVEDHSAIAPEADTDANRRASENWDAPLVVTTQVQLFESLFSNRSSACRKLHNLANAVIVLDEVQSLPSGLLDPILETLQDLRAHYGTSLLLMTATQPSLHRRAIGGNREPKPWLDPAPTDIVPAAELPGLFSALERVAVEWPTGDTPVEWSDLADRIVEHEQVLAIVHRRQDARALWNEVDSRVPSVGTVHLSALMCPVHRRAVLREIQGRLRRGEPCRVVSTQLVEAGVDVDFPVVFRAMAGLEALAQSAGRCNREGRLPGRGRFVVYNAPTQPPGLLRHHADIARLMRTNSPHLSLTSPATFSEYFDRLYANASTDSKGIQALRQELKLAETAATFRMIDEVTTTVFVPWGDEGRRAIDALRFAGPSRQRFRAIQPFGVAVYPEAFLKHRALGLVEELHDSVWCLVSDRSYHPVFGLDLEPEEFQAIVV